MGSNRLCQMIRKTFLGGLSAVIVLTASAECAVPFVRLDPETALVGAKVERKPMPAKWGWQLDAPVRVSVRAETGERLSLVPYGCTRLRKTMFTRVSSGKDQADDGL